MNSSIQLNNELKFQPKDRFLYTCRCSTLSLIENLSIPLTEACSKLQKHHKEKS